MGTSRCVAAAVAASANTTRTIHASLIVVLRSRSATTEIDSTALRPPSATSALHSTPPCDERSALLTDCVLALRLIGELNRTNLARSWEPASVPKWKLASPTRGCFWRSAPPSSASAAKWNSASCDSGR
eukprot:scaffold1904_cov72-Phaeocystis_antarctica.AAC.3